MYMNYLSPSQAITWFLSLALIIAIFTHGGSR